MLCSLTGSYAQFEGTIGIGVHAGYGAEIQRPGAGVHLHYYQTNNLRFAPSFTRYREHKGEGMWIMDADAHYLLPVSYAASLYPLAGVHYSNWRYDAEKAGDPLGKDRTRHRLGTSLGIGFQDDIGYRLRANFELKYQYIKDYSQVVFTAGFGFWF